MRVEVTEAAWTDLLAIGRWIAKDSPERASLFLDELYQCCLSIGAMPLAYPLLPDRKESGIRRRVFSNYIIFYRIGRDTIDILHVLHGARNLDDVLFPED